MIVIADSSPLIYLSWIGKLDLLPALYGRIILPETVYHEVVTNGKDKPGCEEILNADWIEVKKCTDQVQFLKFRLELDAGEAEAITLSMELKADRLIMDEVKGRKMAGKLGISVTGLLGVLLEAKHKGLITSVKDQIDALLTQTTFRVHQQVIQTVLELASEPLT
jgi:uncharacterized protein